MKNKYRCKLIREDGFEKIIISKEFRPKISIAELPKVKSACPNDFVDFGNNRCFYFKNEVNGEYLYYE